MGTVYRKSVTRQLPSGAEIFNRADQLFARWKDRKGRKREARIIVGADGTQRISVEAGTFTAKYRDGSGKVCEVATGCRNELAARAVLGDLERRAELVHAKVLTSTEDAISDHQSTPIDEHFDACGAFLEIKSKGKVYRENTRRYLDRLASECKFATLNELNSEAFVKWLGKQAKANMSARSRNAHREALVVFCNWCIENKRLVLNPFSSVPKANQKADPRRQRRAMTEAELIKLLDAARRRPLLDLLTIRRGKNKGNPLAVAIT